MHISPISSPLLHAPQQVKLLPAAANDNRFQTDGFAKGTLDESNRLMPAQMPAAAPTPPPRLDPVAYLNENPPEFQPALRENARQLEIQWAEKVPAGSGNPNVAIVSTNGWVKDKFVYLQELADSILASGGVPKLIFPSGGSLEEQTKGIHGLLIPGGNDIHPDFYGAKAGPGMNPDSCDKGLDSFELALIKKGYAEDLPMLGICRGHQLMNVAAGGTLVQDIDRDLQKDVLPSARVSHWNDVSAKNRSLRHNADHGIQILDHTRLSAAVGGLLASVNSLHHQCLGSIAPGMAVVAWSMEGQPIPEAIERLGHPHQAGVQFHPEFTRLDLTPGQSNHQRIFTNLVEDGSKYAAANDNEYAPKSANNPNDGWLMQA